MSGMDPGLRRDDSYFSSALSIIGYFESAPTLAVAVSGGADSMALLLMAHEWAQKKGGKAIALTVDHGLRPESAQETTQVRDWCEKRRIEHHILKWHPPSLSSAIQAQARDARYQLLTEWCKKHHVLHLLTAHHQDDQAETLFFRLARGSGLDGLAAMAAVSYMHGIRLVRPLLGIPKSALEALLTAETQPWINDPSNHNPRYTRNRIREQLQAAPHYDALSERAANLAARFGDIRNMLENHAAARLAQVFSIFPEGYGIIHYEPFLELAPDYALRALSAIVMTLSGESYPPRSEKLQRLYEEVIPSPAGGGLGWELACSGVTEYPPPNLLPTGGGGYRRTFNGLLFIPRIQKKCILVCREPKAIAPPTLLPPDTTTLWDKRFQVAWSGGNDTIHVRALGRDGVKIVIPTKAKNKTFRAADAAHWILAFAGMTEALAALPSFWRLEELIAVPHIQHHNPDYWKIGCSARFIPAKPLAATAFFSMNRGTK